MNMGHVGSLKFISNSCKGLSQPLFLLNSEMVYIKRLWSKTFNTLKFL